MTTTAQRSRTVPSSRRGSQYGAYVDGANALQIGYADPVIDDPLLDEPLSFDNPLPFDEPLTDQRPSPAPAGDPDAEVDAPALPMPLPRASFIVFVVAVVIVAVLGVLVLNTKINENSFTLDNLRSQQSDLDAQEQQLNQQLANLESAGNLSAQAARLGLVPAGTPAFLTLPNGRVVGVPQPASGPPAGTGAGAATTGDPGR
jgi:hypothetical protein